MTVPAILPKSEWSCKTCFFKKYFFYSNLSFALVFFLVCLKQYMAVGEGSVNPPKNLRSRHGHDLDYCLLIIVDSIDWCRFHRPDIDFWWYQQCWKKSDHSNYLQGALLSEVPTFYHDYNFRNREVAISPINSWQWIFSEFLSRFEEI